MFRLLDSSFAYQVLCFCAKNIPSLSIDSITLQFSQLLSTTLISTPSTLHIYHMKTLLCLLISNPFGEEGETYLYGANFSECISMSCSDMYFHLPPPLALSFETSLPMKAAIPRLSTVRNSSFSLSDLPTVHQDLPWKVRPSASEQSRQTSLRTIVRGLGLQSTSPKLLRC